MNEILKKIDAEIEVYKKRITTRQGANYHDESERIIRFEERMNEAIRIKEIIEAEYKTDVTDTDVEKIKNNGCVGCKYEYSVEDEIPCVHCKQAYTDEYEPVESEENHE